MTERNEPPFVPIEEWTDKEWLAVLKTIPPDADYRIGEQAVAEMRGSNDQNNNRSH